MSRTTTHADYDLANKLVLLFVLVLSIDTWQRVKDDLVTMIGYSNHCATEAPGELGVYATMKSKLQRKLATS